MVNLIRRLALLLLLLCLGCSAQSNSPAEVNQRVERLVRNHYTLAPDIVVEITNRVPSKDFPQFDQISVKLSRGTQNTTRDFLISKDGQKLFQLTQVKDPLDQMDLSNRPWRGNKDAKVTIVNYDDFQCPFCARNHAELMNSILKTYGDRVKVVYKDFPLVEIHPWAMRAAVDSNCLATQNNDAYWDFADYVHANQREISGPPPNQGDKAATIDQQKANAQKALDDSFQRLDKEATDVATKRGLNTAKLDACMKAQDTSIVQASRKEGDALGISATPTMYVNGAKLDGAVPEPEFRAAIDRALKEAGQPVPATQASAAPPATQPKN